MKAADPPTMHFPGLPDLLVFSFPLAMESLLISHDLILTYPLFHHTLSDTFLGRPASGRLHLPLLRAPFPQIFACLAPSHSVGLNPKFTFSLKSSLTT